MITEAITTEVIPAVALAPSVPVTDYTMFYLAGGAVFWLIMELLKSKYLCRLKQYKTTIAVGVAGALAYIANENFGAHLDIDTTAEQLSTWAGVFGSGTVLHMMGKKMAKPTDKINNSKGE